MVYPSNFRCVQPTYGRWRFVLVPELFTRCALSTEDSTYSAQPTSGRIWCLQVAGMPLPHASLPCLTHQTSLVPLDCSVCTTCHKKLNLSLSPAAILAFWRLVSFKMKSSSSHPVLKTLSVLLTCSVFTLIELNTLGFYQASHILIKESDAEPEVLRKYDTGLHVKIIDIYLLTCANCCLRRL